jgi:acetyltransferase-like isoleucine patch superfamily enzyme
LMLNNNFILNPKRIQQKKGIKAKLKYIAQMPFKKFAQWCGFLNIEYSYVHGEKSRIHIGKNCSTMNTIFNVISGEIIIGNHTIFGHNCMVLTGTHNFIDGKLASLNIPPKLETPVDGRDIYIGEGCFIGSGAIIIGPISIGNNVIIASGSVVYKDIPDSCLVGGNPAEIKKKHD